jgi:hypothetical protein
MNKAGQTGEDLIKAMQACPHPEIFDEIERLRQRERAFYDHLNDLLAKDDADE